MNAVMLNIENSTVRAASRLRIRNSPLLFLRYYYKIIAFSSYYNTKLTKWNRFLILKKETYCDIFLV